MHINSKQQEGNNKYRIYLELLSVFTIFMSLALSFIINIHKYFFYGGLLSSSFFLLLNIFRKNNSYNKVGRKITLGLVSLKHTYVSCSVYLIGLFFMIEGFLGFYEFMLVSPMLLVISMLGYIVRTKEFYYQIDFKKYLVAIGVIVICLLFRIDIFCLIHHTSTNSDLTIAYTNWLTKPNDVEKYRTFKRLQKNIE